MTEQKQKKIVWVRADSAKNLNDRKKLVTTAIEQNFNNIIILKNDLDNFKKLGKFTAIFIKNHKIKLKGEAGEFVEIKSRKDQEYVMKIAGKTDFVLISAKDWKVIPIENLIAAYQKAKTKLLVEVSTAKDAKLYLETLEVGVDGVVLNTNNFKRIIELRKLIDELEAGSIKLVQAKITKIKAVGMGDRVCIDTCSVLNVGEGMLIGSQANGLFLVHSESVESEYVATRPFRVNAGPVHSYVLTSGDKTRYISELQVGDEVIVVDNEGNTRSVVLGRVKIEKRPLILVEAKYQNKKFNIILQNAETIRLISDGKPKSIVDLHEGDSILIWVGDSGRHFGMKIDESIVEK